MGSGYEQAVLESEEGVDKLTVLYRKFLYTGKNRKSQSKDNKTCGRSKQGREMSSRFLPRKQVYAQLAFLFHLQSCETNMIFQGHSGELVKKMRKSWKVQELFCHVSALSFLQRVPRILGNPMLVDVVGASN